MNSYKVLLFIVVLQFLVFAATLYVLLDEIKSLTSKQKSLLEKGICLQKNEHGFPSSQNRTASAGVIPDLTELRKGSSVYCYGKTKKERICKFHNLCYNSKWKQYVFFHGPWSLLRGVPENRFDPALLDLTSIDDHNTQYFNYIDFPVDALDRDFKDITFINDLSLIFHRFNPENLMHVFHDDLIPLFDTLKGFAPYHYANVSLFNAQLAMMDGRQTGPWYELYQKLTKNIIFGNSMTAELTCFKEAIVGLSKDTTWYQYGFKIPQGPIQNKTMETLMLRSFVKHFKTMFNCTEYGEQYVVLISRKRTRLILNQIELSVMLANLFEKEIYFLDIEDHDIGETICLVSQAVAIVGMHGAELILSLFLPEGSTVIELFPYGVVPDNYTPYKTLAELLKLNYIAWKNTNLSMNKAYPERPPQLGGVQHLSRKEQEDIMNAKEVPRHLCCNNPYWLYKIYQDTFVDIPSLNQVIINGLKTSNAFTKKTSVHKNIIFPDRARHINCLIKKEMDNILLKISWEKPVNAQFIDGELMYQVLVQEGSSDGEIHAYELSSTNFSLIASESSLKFRVWLRCKEQGKLGPLSNTVNCKEV